MKNRSILAVAASFFFLLLHLLPMPVLADNCSGLSDCFRGNMLPALLLILGLLLLVGVLWYFGGLAGLGLALRGLIGAAGRSRIIGALARFGRAAGRVLGKWRRPPRRSPTKGLEKQVQNHLEKLKNYKKDPYKNDNKEFLKNTPPERHQQIIESRIRNLERQIKNFRDQIEKIKKGKK